MPHKAAKVSRARYETPRLRTRSLSEEDPDGDPNASFWRETNARRRIREVLLPWYRYVNSKVIRYLAEASFSDPVLESWSNDDSVMRARRILNGESPCTRSSGPKTLSPNERKGPMGGAAVYSTRWTTPLRFSSLC